MIHHALLDGERVLPFAEVIRLWRSSVEFRDFFSRTLAAAPYAAFRWETPPVTSGTVQAPFEFVLVESPELLVAPNPRPFAAQWRAGESVVTFTNLGGDATLVVPCPIGPERAYPHLAAFVRSAPVEQQHALWSAVGEALEARLGERPVWLSTAGAGVAWLHVRLDDRPKYYAYGPYRKVL